MSNQSKPVLKNSIVVDMLNREGFSNAQFDATKRLVAGTILVLKKQLMLVPAHMNLFNPNFIKALTDFRHEDLDVKMLTTVGREVVNHYKRLQDEATKLIKFMGEFLDQTIVNSGDDNNLEAALNSGVELNTKYQEWVLDFTENILDRLNGVVEHYVSLSGEYTQEIKPLAPVPEVVENDSK